MSTDPRGAGGVGAWGRPRGAAGCLPFRPRRPASVPAAPRGRPPRKWRTAACVAAVCASAAGAFQGPQAAASRSAWPEPPWLGRGGVCVWGRARGSRGRGSASPPAACGLHPSPVVHCCFRGGGRVAALRGLGPAARALRGASPSPPGVRRAARITTAGALGYEWSGAGQRRPSVTAAGGG